MRNILMAIPLLGYLLAVFYWLAQSGSEPLHYNHLLFLAVACTLGNVFVLFYHYTTPPHPKFLLLSKRKIAIRTHVISGSVELLAGIIAFFSSDPTVPALIMAGAALVHVGTAFFQTPIVFGAKAMMYSSYIFAISLHFYSAVQLLLNPTSTTWLLNTYLVLNIYVWVRIFYTVYSYIGLFKDSLYSVAILTAGIILIPAVLGPAGNFAAVGFTLWYVILYKLIMQPDAEGLQALVAERTRFSLINQDVKALWQQDKVAAANVGNAAQQSDRELARTVFDQLDLDHSGYLDNDEVARILVEWEASPSFVDAFMTRTAGSDSQLDFDEFYRHVWSIGTIRSRLELQTSLDENASTHSKAEAVFNQLDLDQSGFLDVFELQMLLLEWGLPLDEVDAYIAKYDDGDGKISFDEFFSHMKPIWEFGFNVLLHMQLARA
ncbi:MAG: EF-hand domain-containing protein [Chloroflexota bacterium]